MQKVSTSAVRYEVEDTGTGIPREKRNESFTPFTQVHTTNFREHGTDLGLAIAKGMVELMQGSFEVISEENRGSVPLRSSYRFPACSLSARKSCRRHA